jgi:hypothetical protein
MKNVKHLLFGMFAVLIFSLAFSVFHGFCRGENPPNAKPQSAIESLYPAPTLDYAFAYEEIETGEPAEFELDGLTITPVFTTLTDADESTGLLMGNIVYSTPNMPAFQMKAISYAYYPELGELYAFPHDGSDVTVLLEYLSRLRHQQDEVDLTYYPRK